MTEVGFYPSRKLKKRSNEYFAFLNLWPLIGVLLCLLFIFMIVTGPPFGTRPSIYSYLPKARNGVAQRWANRDDAMHLYVNRDGTLYFGNTKVAAEDIPELIREQVKRGSEKRVYVVVDAHAQYGDVKVALGGVREAGIEKVAFLVEKQGE